MALRGCGSWSGCGPRPGSPVPRGTRYRLSAWLGGTAKSQAAVTVAFLSAAGRVLGAAPSARSGRRHALARRAAAGVLPAATASAQVTLVLATSLTNIDGPGAPRAGYDRAVGGRPALQRLRPGPAPPPLTPPTAHVPRYQHVFLFYFENEDFGSVIGNTRQAPYLNSLLPRASLLANFFAEEHPSDGNYLALAGGSTFGIPLTDPLEENPRYTIRARNIGDLADAAHETWKGYLQSANGPCDDTVHSYFWNDDLPMAYFADVRDRPAYCAAHLVPLQSLRSDLASAATTPNFAWVGPERLHRHGGVRDPGRRCVPGHRTRRDHALARLADPAVAGHHHLRRGRLRPPAPGPAGGRRCCSDRPASGRATCPTCATRTTACSAPSRPRLALAH